MERTFIIEHIGNGKYKVPEDMNQHEINELETILKKVKENKGYPWDINTQPRKIIYVPGKVLNFVT